MQTHWREKDVDFRHDDLHDCHPAEDCAIEAFTANSEEHE